MLAPSASGGIGNCPDPFSAIQKEIKQELNIKQKKICCPKYLGLTREFPRAGKPEMFFVTNTKLRFTEVKKIQKKAQDSAEIEELQEIPIDDIKIHLPEKCKLTLAAKANLYFLQHYLRVS
jgi:hypothetical protein